ncbi:hypothetical protein AVEN_245714-1 [Araneus ventricosus]|uniref:Uncharacterized protein n=1 Tax=Araneus ventricosus TaxID=182803 RepID=A0A4Y2SFM0_ARAVE|nr:hypothetical protein AVEN_245714-1 [Araneus ventricosus]
MPFMGNGPLHSSAVLLVYLIFNIAQIKSELPAQLINTFKSERRILYPYPFACRLVVYIAAMMKNKAEDIAEVCLILHFSSFSCLYLLNVLFHIVRMKGIYYSMIDSSQISQTLKPSNLIFSGKEEFGDYMLAKIEVYINESVRRRIPTRKRWREILNRDNEVLGWRMYCSSILIEV